MVMYQIESSKRKKNKMVIIFIIIIAVVAIAVAIFGGIKMAEYIAKEKEQTNQENQTEQLNIISETKNGQAENENSSQSNENKNNAKLTKKQITAINNIYTSNEKIAYLTFDDGPSNTVTPKILNTLKQENIKATFFVLGTMVKSNPEILKRENEEGHYIANHGYSHVYKNIYANEKKPLEEYNKTNKLIQEALENPEYQSNVFRFPGGSVGGYYSRIKNNAKKVFEQNNIAYLDWNCLTNDADGADTKDKIMKNLKSTCKNKNSIVVLMHDAPNKDLTAQTLPDVINYLKEQGYKFKNLYDVI